MPLNLPKPSALTPNVAFSVGQQLMSTISGQPAAASAYTFYEEVDAWLGPWGESGYPIGYGKKYNILFGRDPILNAPRFPIVREWVRRTTRHLQLALIDEIVDAIRTNQLYRIIHEPNLREAAFNSHPKAYLDGGLIAVATYEPACLPIIAMIPYEQFNPSNPNFIPTFRQVIAVVQQGGVLEWYNALCMAKPRMPISALKVAVEEVVQHAPSVTLPNPRAMVEQALARELAALRDRYDPLRRFFY